jgi:hypothetical protein
MNKGFVMEVKEIIKALLLSFLEEVKIIFDKFRVIHKHFLIGDCV